MKENEKPKYPVLRARLSAVFDSVRCGSVAADVGTDHAHLPIALCLSDVCPRVIASDVRDGPIASARANVERYGLSDRITVVKTDGLLGIERYDPDDVLISGMGGELIVRILSEAPFTRSAEKRLVLQPQTHPEEVRRYLLQGGFRIVRERLALDDGDRLYQVIVAEYDGKAHTVNGSAEERFAFLCGAPDMGQDGVLYRLLLERMIAVYERRVAGKRSAEKETERSDAADDEEMLGLLKRTLASEEAENTEGKL